MDIKSMGNNQNIVVSFEMAKLLKLMNYNKPTEYFYSEKDGFGFKCGLNKTRIKLNYNNIDNEIFSAPLINEVAKFLNY